MRATLSTVLGLLAIGLFVGSVTMNWPSSPSEWASNSYDVSWGRYALAIVLATLAMLILWWPEILRTYRALKRCGGGGDHRRLVTHGIGWDENRRRKNPWPKRRLQ